MESHILHHVLHIQQMSQTSVTMSTAVGFLITLLWLLTADGDALVLVKPARITAISMDSVSITLNWELPVSKSPNINLCILC